MSSATVTDNALISKVRKEGAQAFERSPMPTRKDEYWRFTKLRGVELDSVPASLECTGADIDAARTRVANNLTSADEVAGEILHVGYETTEISVDAANLPEGVIFSTLRTAASEHTELVDKYFGSVVPNGDTCDDTFANLNTANLVDGAFLYVPRNTRVELPFRADVVMAAGAVNWRALIVLEEGAEATFVEEFTSTAPDQEGFSNAVVELVAGANAHLHYVTVQDYAVPVQNFATHRVLAHRDAQVQWSAVGLGASIGKCRMEAHMVGAGSNVKLTGAYFVDGSQQIDYDTYQLHQAPNATSDLFFKGALADKAHAVWRGMIAVAPGAQGTDGFQNNKNLILNSGAHADSVPGLQIEANEVRCTHASTTSKVDAEQLFYLQARGITRADAIREIVRGFFADALARIEVEQVRDQVRDALWQRLDQTTIA